MGASAFPFFLGEDAKIMIDTLDTAKRLRAAGLTEEQAAVLSDALAEAGHSDCDRKIEAVRIALERKIELVNLDAMAKLQKMESARVINSLVLKVVGGSLVVLIAVRAIQLLT